MNNIILGNDYLPVNQESVVSENQVQVTPSGISHGFDTGYAMAYGVDEAIMIRNLQFFITANANRGLNLHEGRYWTYDRLEDFLNHFPYWSVQNVRRIIASLISQEVIIKGEFNHKWSNRTQWYAFKDQDKFIKNTKPPKAPYPQPPSDFPKPENADLLKSTNDSCWNQQLTDVGINNCYKDTSSLTYALTSSSSLKVPEQKTEIAKKANPKDVAKAAEMESKPTHKPKREKPDFSTKVREIGNQLINSLTREKPDYLPPKNLSAFLNEVDFLLRLDKRDPQRLMDVFNWAVSDSFWSDKMYKPNPAKYFREKYDQLDKKMNAKPPKNPNEIDRRQRDQDGNVVDEWKDRMF